MTSGLLLTAALVASAPPQPCPICASTGAPGPSRNADPWDDIDGPAEPSDPAETPPQGAPVAESAEQGPDLGPSEDPNPVPGGTGQAGDTAGPSTEAGKGGAVDVTILDQNEDSPEAARPPRRRGGATPPNAIDLDSESRRQLAAEYRPRSNPAKLHIAARAIYYAGSSADGRSFIRATGLSADVGVSWNYVGVAATMTALPGNTTQYSAGRNGAEGTGPGLFGGGLTLNLGRLALVGRGVLALNAGYDVYAQPVRSTTIEPDYIILRSTQLLVPHGPRLGLDLGLQTLGRPGARYRHAVGIHMGWQLLIQDARAKSRASDESGVSFSPTNALMVGLSYWMG